MNEKTNKAGATSGQNVPKSPKSKFRHKSQQEQTAASKLRMEKRGEKLEKAKEKLAKQKPPKPPGPVRRVAGTVGGGVHGYVHGKIFEGGAGQCGHRGRSPFRAGRRVCPAPRQAVCAKENPGAPGQGCPQGRVQAHQGHGGLSLPHGRPGAPGNAGQRPVPADPKAEDQAAICQTSTEAAKQGARPPKKTAVTTEKLAARAVGFVKRHPVGALMFVAVFLLTLR